MLSLITLPIFRPGASVVSAYSCFEPAEEYTGAGLLNPGKDNERLIPSPEYGNRMSNIVVCRKVTAFVIVV